MANHRIGKEQQKAQARTGSLDGYLQVFNDLPSLMWRAGKDGKCNFVNNSWLSFTGRSAEQESGDGWLDGLHPDDLERFRSALSNAIANQQPFELEFRLRDHSGEYRWVQNIARPIKDSDGNFSGFIGTCFDLSERKRMEADLGQTQEALAAASTARRESEALFKSMFQYSPDAVVAVNEEGNITLVNWQAQQLFGYSLDEMIGKPVESLMPGEFHERHRKHVAAYLKNPHVRPMGVNLSLFGRRKDGSFFPADINLGPVVTTQGKMVIATIRDTTERKKTEEAIQERDKMLTAAVQAAPITFFKIDRDGVLRLVLGQKSARQVYGVDMVNRSIYEINENPQLIECFEQALAGETVTRLIEFDEHAYETTYVPLQSDSGEITGVLGVAVEVTRHRAVVEALRESEAQFRTIFNDSAEGIKLLDAEGRIVKANPALQEMLGYSAEELTTMRYSDMTHPDDVEMVREMFDRLMAGKTDHFRIEKRYKHKNGQIIWGRLAMSLFRGNDGTPLYGIGMIENITAQKEIEAELAELQRRLIDSAEIERLNLSQDLHDGPLQDLQVMGFQISMLQSMIGEKEAGANGALEELASLEEELHKVTASIRAICGELRPPALTPFGLEKTIRSHADHFQEQHPDLNVTLDLMSDGKALPERVRLALFRIYQHSMANIIRHAKASSVKVSFHFDEDIIELKIEDDGVGFNVPRRWIELVRDEHFGLVGSIERAESIGGKMVIESSEGAGTRITVTVPRREEEQVTQRERFKTSFAL